MNISIETLRLSAALIDARICDICEEENPHACYPYSSFEDKLDWLTSAYIELDRVLSEVDPEYEPDYDRGFEANCYLAMQAAKRLDAEREVENSLVVRAIENPIEYPF